jgi:tetratricopeptide (TPR) repeat protein
MIKARGGGLLLATSLAWRAGRRDEALEMTGELEQLLPHLEGEVEYARALNGLATFLSAAGQPERVLALVDPLIRADDDGIPQHNLDLGLAYMMRGISLSKLGALTEARSALVCAMDYIERIQGTDGVASGAVLANQGLVEQKLGELERAEQYYREAVDGTARRLGKRHDGHVLALGSLARIQIELRDWPEAEALHRELLELQLEVFGPEHFQVAWTRSGLGRCAEERGDFGAAADEYREAARIRASLGDAKHALQSWTDAARVEERRGEIDRAMEAWREALGQAKASPAAGDEVEALRALARLSRAKGDEPAAREFEARANELADRTP